jgi:hypothetical protein
LTEKIAIDTHLLRLRCVRWGTALLPINLIIRSSAILFSVFSGPAIVLNSGVARWAFVDSTMPSAPTIESPEAVVESGNNG